MIIPWMFHWMEITTQYLSVVTLWGLVNDMSSSDQIMAFIIRSDIFSQVMANLKYKNLSPGEETKFFSKELFK